MAGDYAPEINQCGRQMPHEATRVRDIEPFFKRAKIYVEVKLGLWDWNDDIEFIGLSRVEFKDRASA